MQNRKRTKAEIKEEALSKAQTSAFDRAVQRRRGITGLDMETGPKKVDQMQRIPNSYKRHPSVPQSIKGSIHAVETDRMPKLGLQQIDLDVINQFATSQERSVRGGNGRNLLLNLLNDSQDETPQNNQTKLSPIEQRLAAASKLVRGSLDQALSAAFG